jgi:hypothetical protein
MPADRSDVVRARRERDPATTAYRFELDPEKLNF